MIFTNPISFAEKVIRAVGGETGIIEPSYVFLPGVEGGAEIQKLTGCEFFSCPVELGVSSLLSKRR
jgi:malate dehydrogenase